MKRVIDWEKTMAMYDMIAAATGAAVIIACDPEDVPEYLRPKEPGRRMVGVRKTAADAVAPVYADEIGE